jgi:Na+-transporting NADH:ubiquinone oxidoreductase subunit NqrD
VSALTVTMLACSVCFGASDSPLAQGTNMGVFFMLGVTVLMLAAFASFFIYLIRRQRMA